jgi:hypothetical protein
MELYLMERQSCRRWGELSMPKSHLVAQHVPYLRRYARALTGNQESGDSYVAATLEALVRQPDLIKVTTHPRVALFQVFSTIWNSIEVNDGTDRVVNLVPAERHLGQIIKDIFNSFEVPVIFITAYPERFLSGERPEPAFLISKPYQKSTVSGLISQALFFERNAAPGKKRAAG